MVKIINCSAQKGIREATLDSVHSRKIMLPVTNLSIVIGLQQFMGLKKKKLSDFQCGKSNCIEHSNTINNTTHKSLLEWGQGAPLEVEGPACASSDTWMVVWGRG